jgi:hypothetical protein|tara:strand:+ start:8008 stop:8496 length:489 start_codon:yes stop_codon:yes gene_type:complete
MVNSITLSFPEFITHIPQSKKKWIKIGYNKIHAGGHFSIRNALVGAMHSYLEKHIPLNLDIETPIETHLIVYVPINYGAVKRLKNRDTGDFYINWKPAKPHYVPNWDIGNLAMIWLKSIDDVLQKRGVIKDDTVEFVKKTTYEFREVANLKDRKLEYILKTI